MSELDRMLRFYNQELSYLRGMGRLFAERHPKIAGRLELGPTEIADPHVERLVESFAFLTGRVQRILHDDFPEIARELLAALHPHYTQPIPSMTVAAFTADPDQVTTGTRIPRDTRLFARAEVDPGLGWSSRSGGGTVCWFSTRYQTDVWPLEVTGARFDSPDRYPFLGDAQQASSLLSLTVEAPGPALPELEVAPGPSENGDGDPEPFDRLTFYLHGEPHLASALYEVLFGQTVALWVVPDGNYKAARQLPLSALRPLGFDDAEAVLPDPLDDHPGYRLLQEYFTFPQKFHFFELSGLGGLGERKLELLLFFRRLPETRLTVSPETFRLGCTPVVNLFPRTSEPIHLDQTATEYRLVPDARRDAVTEVHTVLEVAGAVGAERRRRVYAPFYSFHHGLAERGQGAFWHARRVPADRPGVWGTDVLLSFLDLDWHPTQPAEDTVYARTLCTNRDLPRHLPAGAKLDSDGAGGHLAIRALHRPTAPRSPALAGQVLWRLVSHLQVSHLSLTSDRGLEALRELLRLYADTYQPSEQYQAEGLVGLWSRKILRLLPEDPYGGFVRGTEIRLRFKESRYAGSSAFLLASVLDRFLALWASINSFTEVVVESEERLEEGDWKRWPPRAGDQPLL
jgi:type VI secretion system protein ImpG